MAHHSSNERLLLNDVWHLQAKLTQVHTSWGVGLDSLWSLSLIGRWQLRSVLSGLEYFVSVPRISWRHRCGKVAVALFIRSSRSLGKAAALLEEPFPNSRVDCC